MSWGSHGEGQSGPSVISAADGGDSGHGDMRVGCSHTGGIGGSRIGLKGAIIRGAVHRTSQSLKMGRRINYSKRQTSNTPLPDLAVETTKLHLQSKYDETESRLGHAHFLQLLQFCLKTYFMFDGTIYWQVRGTPMGSSISGLIAEAILHWYESPVSRHHKAKFWNRYVDSIYAFIVQSQVLEFKEHLDAVFPDILLTMEKEENNQLAFLDVLICCKDFGGLKTEVFRKATSTTQVLSYNSNHPSSHKRSRVRALYQQVETLQ
ncbi:Acyl-CoA synthetase member 2 mitochondrial [Sparganum proliferum]